MTCGKPNWQLLKEAGQGLTKEGKSQFTRRQLIERVWKSHPGIGENILNPMIQGMTINLKGGAPGGVGKDIFHSVERGMFEMYTGRKRESVPLKSIPVWGGAIPTTLRDEGSEETGARSDPSV
ncbi:MAG TPA: hypothetical protein VGW77_03785 [Candidatus Binatia bacterium]|jgi:hypothetical protein|nr:hypothetical protein [Candidatus Binatia bacterium]